MTHNAALRHVTPKGVRDVDTTAYLEGMAPTPPQHRLNSYGGSPDGPSLSAEAVEAVEAQNADEGDEEDTLIDGMSYEMETYLVVAGVYVAYRYLYA